MVFLDRQRNGKENECRYQKAHADSEGDNWLPPSLEHRILTTETWVKRLMLYAPISGLWIEKVKFD
ncbi:MAG: RRXRR domain-containing protein, partial [Pseudomonadota bacterium]